MVTHPPGRQFQARGAAEATRRPPTQTPNTVTLTAMAKHAVVREKDCIFCGTLLFVEVPINEQDFYQSAPRVWEVLEDGRRIVHGAADCRAHIARILREWAPGHTVDEVVGWDPKFHAVDMMLGKHWRVMVG